VIAIAFAPDGGTLAAAGGDGDVRVWNPETGIEESPFPRQGSGATGTLSFSADGSRLAFAGDQVVDAGTPRLGRGDATRCGDVRGSPRNVFASAFAPDGRTVATAGGDGVLILWDTITGREVRRLDGHDGGRRQWRSCQTAER
jgi:WD40 repeat protein